MDNYSTSAGNAFYKNSEGETFRVVRILLFSLLILIRIFTALSLKLENTVEKEKVKKSLKSFAPQALEVLSIKRRQGGDQVIFGSREGVRLLSYKFPEDGGVRLYPGDFIIFQAELSEPQIKANPGNFDEAGYLRQLPADLVVRFPKKIRLIKGTDGKMFFKRSFQRLSDKITEIFVLALGEKLGGLSAAVSFGDEKFLDTQIKKDFRKAGLSHILVVSGSNLHLLLIIFSEMRIFLFKTYAGRRFFSVGLCLFFAMLSGFDPSMSRALICIIVCEFFAFLKKSISHPRAVRLSAFVMIMADPLNILRISFILSSISALSIALFLRPASETAENICKKFIQHITRLNLFKRKKMKIKVIHDRASDLFKLISYPVLICIIANWATLPIIALINGNFRITQVFFSVPATLISEILVILSFFALPLFCIFSALKWAQIPCLVIRSAATFILKLAGLGASSKFRLFPGGINTFLTLILPTYLYAVLSLVPSYFFRRKRLKLSVMGFILCCGFIICRNALSPELRIDFIDVLQGSSVFVRAKSGMKLLYDCGSEKSSEMLISFLRHEGVEQVDCLVLSHYHEDHVGGLKNLIGEISIKSAYIPVEKGEREEKEKFDEIVGLLKGKGCSVHYVEKDLFFESASLKFSLYPNKNVGSFADENEKALLLFIRNNGFSGMFTADMDSGRWAEVYDILKGGKLSCVQVPHHGSRNSLPPGNLGNKRETAKPYPADIAVIQCGRNNRYGHPHKAVLESLKREGLPCYRTDESGLISAEIRGSELKMFKFLSGERESYKLSDSIN